MAISRSLPTTTAMEKLTSEFFAPPAHQVVPNGGYKDRQPDLCRFSSELLLTKPCPETTPETARPTSLSGVPPMDFGSYLEARTFPSSASRSVHREICRCRV